MNQADIGAHVDRLVDRWWSLSPIQRLELRTTDDPGIEDLFVRLDLLAESVVGELLPR